MCSEIKLMKLINNKKKKILFDEKKIWRESNLRKIKKNKLKNNKNPIFKIQIYFQKYKPIIIK